MPPNLDNAAIAATPKPAAMLTPQQLEQAAIDSNQKEADFNQKEGSSIGLIPLPKLTHSGEYARKETVCPKGTEWMNNVVDSVAEKAEGRKIPKIVHMTGKSRCLTPTAHSMISMWKFENHSFYYHDDEAMFSLLLDTDFPGKNLSELGLGVTSVCMNILLYIMINNKIKTN